MKWIEIRKSSQMLQVPFLSGCIERQHCPERSNVPAGGWGALQSFPSNAGLRNLKTALSLFLEG